MIFALSLASLAFLAAASGGAGPVSYTYKRPGGVDEYRRPGGTDTYIRP